MAKAATPEMYALAERMATVLWKNIYLLRADEPEDPELYIYNWAIFLGVLTLDIFESTILLLRNAKYRSAVVNIRCLEDYAIRIRYYHVQAIKPRADMTAHPGDAAKHRLEIEAIAVWGEAESSLAKKMSQYHEDVWPEEVFEDLKIYSEDKSKSNQRSMPNMAMFLMKHECDNRDVLPVLRTKLEKHYQNTMAEWLVHSNVVHGAQGAISDVFEMNGEHEYTGRIWRGSSEVSQTLLYAAFNQVHHFMETIGLIRGWAYNALGSFQEAVDLWQANRSAPEHGPFAAKGIEDEGPDARI